MLYPGMLLYPRIILSVLSKIYTEYTRIVPCWLGSTIRYVTFEGLVKCGAYWEIIDGGRGLKAIKFSQAFVMWKRVYSVYV